jgi:hypothetical protein
LASSRLIRRAAVADASMARRLLRGAALLRDIEHTTVAFAGFMRAGGAPVIREQRPAAAVVILPALEAPTARSAA